METKFSTFLRSGGNGAFLLQREGPCWTGKSDGLSAKAEIPAYGQLRDQFAANLERAEILNRQYILSRIGSAFYPPLQSDDLSNVSAEHDAALERWDEPEYVPDTGAGYWGARAAAEWEGTRDVAGEFLGQIIQSIENFPG